MGGLNWYYNNRERILKQTFERTRVSVLARLVWSRGLVLAISCGRRIVRCWGSSLCTRHGTVRAGMRKDLTVRALTGGTTRRAMCPATCLLFRSVPIL